MRNLSLWDIRRTKCPVKLGPSESKTTSIWTIAVDPDSDASYVTTEDAGWRVAGGEVRECPALSAVIRDGTLVAAEWLADQQALCVFTKDGAMGLYSADSDQLDVVCSLHPALEAVGWSGDQDLVAVLAAGPVLLLATSYGEVIAEEPLFSQQFGEMEPVTVGWGRKETQFHGSAGKAAARQAPPTVSDVTPSGDVTGDGRPRISWRGDGQMLAVGAACPATGVRRFVVFSRSGQRLSTSELVPNLGAPLAWRPSGAEVAAAQTLPNKLQVVFFEKNGLRHGEFTLPVAPDTATVRELAWSPDSAALAVLLDFPASSESRLQIWTTGNYHWYCKHERRFAAEDRPRALAWHPIHDLRLIVVTSSGSVSTLNFQWSPSCGGGATAAVIDGARVLVTPLAITVVPPPMSAHELTLPAAANAVCQTHSSGDGSWLMVVGADNCLHAFRETAVGEGEAAAPSPPSSVCCGVRATAGAAPQCGFSARAPLHSYCGSCPLPAAAVDTSWAWQLVGGEKLRLLFAERAAAGPRVVVMDVQVAEEAATMELQERSATVLESAAVSITAIEDSAEVLVHCCDGRSLFLDAETGAVTPLEDSNGGEAALPLHALQLRVVSSGDGRRCVLALTSQRRLYVDGRELLSGCTSFAVSDQFLLVTTTEHSLRCLPLRLLAQAGNADPWLSVGTRRLERGARLVTAVSGDTPVVLQMPRGNLEVVHPRPLVVSRLAALMDRGDYHAAYAEMRRHRISLNLLVDHAPETFAVRCHQICRALAADPSWLCVLVSELGEEDVTQSLYSDVYAARADPRAVWASGAGSGAGGKVDTVCELVRRALEGLDRRRLMLPILTTLVKHTTPRLEEALRVINSLRDEPAEAGAVTADAALQYLVVLVDVDELYTIALGTYDFQLVVMVAEKSQKDPKEYLPFLSELRALPEPLRKYRVDCHLRRWAAALGHLSAAGAQHHQQLQQLVVEHALYTQALRLYTPGTPEYKAICGLYAAHLAERGRHWEAGTFYLRAGAQTSAVDALRRAGAWRDCLLTAAHAGISGEQLRELAAALAAEQLARGAYAAAAELHERHLRQPDRQVACLLEGRLWCEAVHACHRARRPQMIELVVRPAVERAAAATLESVERISSTLSERCCRLHTVREVQVQQRQRRSLLPDGDGGGADADLYSDTSSVSNLTGSSSAGSSRTHQSSKSKRKQERKRYSLREGSGTEDLALIAACHGLVTEAYALIDDVASLLRALVQQSAESAAGELQEAFSSLLTQIDRLVTKVWPPPPPEGEQTTFGPGQTTNQLISILRGGGDVGAASLSAERMALMEPHLRYPPAPRKDASWKLLCLEKSENWQDVAADR